jgi:hydrogenase maturation protease
MNFAEKQVPFIFDQDEASEVSRSPGISIAILGLGNRFRGDDGAGCAVVDKLAITGVLPENIHLFEDGTGDLFDAILSNKYERVILIDAAEIKRQPGEWICLNADWLTWKPDDKNNCCDGHRMSLANALALGHALEVLPKELLIYAVQPMSLEWTGNLSEPVREAVSEITESILHEIREYS